MSVDRTQTTGPGPVMLAARDVSTGYHGVPVVRGLNLEVRAGEVVLLAGPNGAGKTTTMMTLAGAIRPLSGTTEFAGEPTRLPMHKRVRLGMGVVTEKRSIFYGLTVADNLRLGRGTKEDALGYFPELRERLGVKAGQLSGGEQQMLSLARVIAARPRAVIADEMSLGLAPILVKRLLAALRNAADNGAAVLIVEQHVRVALEMADRACFLKRGSIVLHGSAAQLRNQEREIEDVYL
ncbi:MAG: ABC transporter ATP-binding protein [Solirubrobacterales bacterium]|nr:ABC transporter ATP-binding protein [Solirubrobacterales bacterium]